MPLPPNFALDDRQFAVHLETNRSIDAVRLSLLIRAVSIEATEFPLFEGAPITLRHLSSGSPTTIIWEVLGQVATIATLVQFTDYLMQSTLDAATSAVRRTLVPIVEQDGVAEAQVIARLPTGEGFSVRTLTSNEVLAASRQLPANSGQAEADLEKVTVVGNVEQVGEELELHDRTKDRRFRFTPPPGIGTGPGPGLSQAAVTGVHAGRINGISYLTNVEIFRVGAKQRYYANEVVVGELVSREDAIFKADDGKTYTVTGGLELLPAVGTRTMVGVETHWRNPGQIDMKVLRVFPLT